MAQITTDKPPENMVPYKTPVEDSCRRMVGIRTKATLYSCNFVRNDNETAKPWVYRDIK